MVMDRITSVVKEAEEKLGLPPLSKFADSIEKLPDARYLRLVKETLEVAERVSLTAPSLETVVHLIEEIKSIPPEQLDKVYKVLNKIDSIIKKAPADLLDVIAKIKED